MKMNTEDLKDLIRGLIQESNKSEFKTVIEEGKNDTPEVLAKQAEIDELKAEKKELQAAKVKATETLKRYKEARDKAKAAGKPYHGNSNIGAGQRDVKDATDKLKAITEKIKVANDELRDIKGLEAKKPTVLKNKLKNVGEMLNEYYGGSYKFLCEGNHYFIETYRDGTLQNPTFYGDAKDTGAGKEDLKEIKTKLARIKKLFNSKLNVDDKGEPKLLPEDIEAWIDACSKKKANLTYQDQMRWIHDGAHVFGENPWIDLAYGEYYAKSAVGKKSATALSNLLKEVKKIK